MKITIAVSILNVIIVGFMVYLYMSYDESDNMSIAINRAVIEALMQ